MNKAKLENFLSKELSNVNDCLFEIQTNNTNYYVVFYKILGKTFSKELLFKIFDTNLYLHSTTYGWKNVEKLNANKYFWIELLDNS